MYVGIFSEVFCSFACVWKWLFIVFCFYGEWVPWAPTRPLASHLLRTPLRMKVKWLQEFVFCALGEYFLKQIDTLWKEGKREICLDFFTRVWRERVKGNFCHALVSQWITRIVRNRLKQIQFIKTASPSPSQAKEQYPKKMLTNKRYFTFIGDFTSFQRETNKTADFQMIGVRSF